MLNNSTIWLVNMKPRNKQMHCCISPRRACNPCGYTMKISSRYHRLLIYDVKRTTKIDGIGPFKMVGVTHSVPIYRVKYFHAYFVVNAQKTCGITRRSVSVYLVPRVKYAGLGTCNNLPHWSVRILYYFDWWFSGNTITA